MRLTGSSNAAVLRMSPAFSGNRTGHPMRAVPGQPPDRVSFSGKTGALTPAERSDLNRMLDTIERKGIRYFLDYRTPSGLIPDRVKYTENGPKPGNIASIAATGFGLAILPLAVEKGMISRKEARQQAEKMLETAMKGTGPQHRGWLAHFLDGDTGQPLPTSEFSSIDTTLFMLGAIVAGEYFGGNLRKQVNTLFNGIDFGAMLTQEGNDRDSKAFSLGFHQRDGHREYIRYRWDEYSEGVLVPLIALASGKTPDAVWESGWDRSRQWQEDSDKTFVRLPLFTYFYPHAFLNLKDKKDAAGDDFWEASKAAVRMHRRFCREKGYPEHIFGLTACDGPAGYRVYWPSEEFQDGTIGPPAVVACLPFDERGVYDSLKAMERQGLLNDPFGIACAWNIHSGWRPDDALGIDMGSMILMIDAAREGQVHRLSGKSPLIKKALKRAGFENGDAPSTPTRSHQNSGSVKSAG